MNGNKPLTKEDVYNSMIERRYDKIEIKVCIKDDVLSAREGLKEEIEIFSNELCPSSQLDLKQLIDKWFNIGGGQK